MGDKKSWKVQFSGAKPGRREREEHPWQRKQQKHEGAWFDVPGAETQIRSSRKWGQRLEQKPDKEDAHREARDIGSHREDNESQWKKFFLSLFYEQDNILWLLALCKKLRLSSWPSSGLTWSPVHSVVKTLTLVFQGCPFVIEKLTTLCLVPLRVALN
jgi:hypothetical protein